MQKGNMDGHRCIQQLFAVEAVKWLLKKGAEAHSKDATGETPLQIACSIGHVEIAKFRSSERTPIGARRR